MPFAFASSLRGSTSPTVVLVHGLLDRAGKMRRIERMLREAGRSVLVPTLTPSDGRAGIDLLAQRLRDFIAAECAPNEMLDLVGFSMGGLICRYYVQKLEPHRPIRKFITISAPHRGSMLAHLLPNTGGRQMRPGSAFLNDLNEGLDTLHACEFWSIWTPFDLMILPAHSSRIGVGKEHRCWELAHPLMVLGRRGARRIVDILLDSSDDRPNGSSPITNA